MHDTGQWLLERYGMTETNMILSNPYRGERRAGFVGLPLPGVHVRTVPDDDAEASHDSGIVALQPQVRCGLQFQCCRPLTHLKVKLRRRLGCPRWAEPHDAGLCNVQAVCCHPGGYPQ